MHAYRKFLHPQNTLLFGYYHDVIVNLSAFLMYPWLLVALEVDNMTLISYSLM